MHIGEKSGKTAKKRVTEYSKIINSFKNYSELKQLTKVNVYLNKLKYKSDKKVNKKNDYWSTPKEFLAVGAGDCEDYAIIKYFTLLKLGFKKDKLFITLAYDRYSKNYHMVLSYFNKANKPPLILDSLSQEVLTLTKRADLKVGAFINSDGVYILGRNSKLTKTNHTSRKFKELLKRVQGEC